MRPSGAFGVISGSGVMSEATYGFTLVPEGTRWPSGDYISLAELAVDRQWVSDRIGAPLVAGIEDGLGPWVAIGLELGSGLAVELIEYEWAPGPRVFEVRVDRGANPALALESVLAVLGLSRDRLRWISPLVEVPST